jgi:hypothetical protein
MKWAGKRFEATSLNSNRMEQSKTYTIEELDRYTDFYRKSITNAVEPDRNDPAIPESVFKYKPVTWEEDPGVWHTLFGRIPEDGIWTMGTSAVESMQEFDKELQVRFDTNCPCIINIEEPLRQKIHQRVFAKIDNVMGWDDAAGKN